MLNIPIAEFVGAFALAGGIGGVAGFILGALRAQPR